MHRVAHEAGMSRESSQPGDLTVSGNFARGNFLHDLIDSSIGGVDFRLNIYALLILVWKIL